jgi:hypothetical protein
LLQKVDIYYELLIKTKPDSCDNATRWSSRCQNCLQDRRGASRRSATGPNTRLLVFSVQEVDLAKLQRKDLFLSNPVAHRNEEPRVWFKQVASSSANSLDDLRRSVPPHSNWSSSRKVREPRILSSIPFCSWWFGKFEKF